VKPVCSVEALLKWHYGVSSHQLSPVTQAIPSLPFPVLPPASVRQVFGRMKDIVDDKHWEDDCRLEDIEIPFVGREITFYALCELCKAVYRANLCLDLVHRLLYS
jgi:hypothetical protein